MAHAHVRPASPAAVDIPVDRLAQLYERWNIDTVELYGSVVSEDFPDEGPVEVMATFAPTARPSLFDWAAIEEELAAAFGRPATLTTRRAAESNTYPSHHRRMRETARVVYAR